MAQEKLELLAVEDQESSRQALQFILVPKYKVQFATTLKEAFEILEQKTFDIILCDMELPDGLGIDLLKKVKRDSAKQEVIMVTGVEEEGVIKEANALGVISYVHKPLILEELEKIVLSQMAS